MFLEIKMLLSSIGIIAIAFVLSQIILVNMLLGFLLIVGIGMIVFGDMLIGYLITRNRLQPQLDPTPPRKETCILFTLAGGFDVINTVKGPHGKREFKYNGKEASVINRGDYQVRLPNGNSAFVAHESLDENIDMFEAKYAEKMEKDVKTDDVREWYAIAKEVDNL